MTMSKNKKGQASEIVENEDHILSDNSDPRQSFRARHSRWYQYLNETALQGTNKPSTLVSDPPILDEQSFNDSEAHKLKSRRSWWKVLGAEKSVVGGFSRQNATMQNSVSSSDNDEDDIPLEARPKRLFRKKNSPQDKSSQSFSDVLLSNNSSSKTERRKSISNKQEAMISSDATEILTPVKVKKLFKKRPLNRSSDQFIIMSSSEESDLHEKSKNRKTKKLTKLKEKDEISERENNFSLKDDSSKNFSDPQSEIFTAPSRKLFSKFKSNKNENSNLERSALRKRNKLQDSNTDFSAAFETELELSTAKIKTNVTHFSSNKDLSVFNSNDSDTDEHPVKVKSGKVLANTSKFNENESLKKKKLFQSRNRSNYSEDFQNCFEESSKESVEMEENKSKKELSSISLRRKNMSELSKEITEPLETRASKLRTPNTPIKASFATMETDDIFKEPRSVSKISTTNFSNLEIPSVNSKTDISQTKKRSIGHDLHKNVSDLANSGDNLRPRKKLFGKARNISSSSNDFEEAFVSDISDASKSKIHSKAMSHKVTKDIGGKYEKLENLSRDKDRVLTGSNDFSEDFENDENPQLKSDDFKEPRRVSKISTTNFRNLEIPSVNSKTDISPMKKRSIGHDLHKNVSDLANSGDNLRPRKKLFGKARNISSSSNDFEEAFVSDVSDASKSKIHSKAMSHKVTKDIGGKYEKLENLSRDKDRVLTGSNDFSEDFENDENPQLKSDDFKEPRRVSKISTTNFRNLEIPSVNSKTDISPMKKRSIGHDLHKNVSDLANSGDNLRQRKKLFGKARNISSSSNDFEEAFVSDISDASKSKIHSKAMSHKVTKDIGGKYEKLENLSRDKDRVLTGSNDFSEDFENDENPQLKSDDFKEPRRVSKISTTNFRNLEIPSVNSKTDISPMKKRSIGHDLHKNVSDLANSGDNLRQRKKLFGKARNISSSSNDFEEAFVSDISDASKSKIHSKSMRNESRKQNLSNQTDFELENDEIPPKKTKKVSKTPQKNVSLSDEQKKVFAKNDSSSKKSKDSVKALESGVSQLKSKTISISQNVMKVPVVRIERQDDLFRKLTNQLNKRKGLDDEVIPKSKPKLFAEKRISKNIESSDEDISYTNSPMKPLTRSSQSKNSNYSKNDSKMSNNKSLLENNAIVEIHTDVTKFNTPKKQNRDNVEMSSKDTDYTSSDDDPELPVSKRMKTSKTANVSEKFKPEINLQNTSVKNKQKESSQNKSDILSTDAIVFIHSPELLQSAQKLSNRNLIPAHSTRRSLSFGKTMSSNSLDLSGIEKVPSNDRSGEKMVLSKSGELSTKKKVIFDRKTVNEEQNNENLDKTVETPQKSIRNSLRSSKRKSSQKKDAEGGHDSQMSFMTVVDQVIRTNKKYDKSKNSTEMELTEPVSQALIINKRISSERGKKSLNSETQTSARRNLKFEKEPEQNLKQSKIPVWKSGQQTTVEKKSESTTKKKSSPSHTTTTIVTPVKSPVNLNPTVNIQQMSPNSIRNASAQKTKPSTDVFLESEDENVNNASGVNSLVNLNESRLQNRSSNITPNKKTTSKTPKIVDFDTNRVMTPVQNLTPSNNNDTVSKTKSDKKTDSIINSPDWKSIEGDEKLRFGEKNVSVVRPSPRKNKEVALTRRWLLFDDDEDDAVGVAIRKATEEGEKRAAKDLAKLRSQKITDYFTVGSAKENNEDDFDQLDQNRPPKQTSRPKPTTKTPVKKKKEFDWNKNARLYMPKPYITKKLYKFLIEKLEPKYGEMAKAKSIKFVKFLVPIVTTILRRKTYQRELVMDLKRELVRLQIISTNWQFYNFLWDYLPNDFQNKVIAKRIWGSGKTTVPYEQEPLLEPLDYHDI